MNRTKFITRTLLVLVLVQALIYWETVKLIANHPFNIGALVAVVYFLLTIASLVGLLLARSWGFYALYGLIVFGTVMLSIKFLPVPLTFLPIAQRWIGLTVINVAVLVLAGVGHYWSRRGPTYLPPGAA